MAAVAVDAHAAHHAAVAVVVVVVGSCRMLLCPLHGEHMPALAAAVAAVAVDNCAEN